MILYLSYWFPARERARAVGVLHVGDRDLLRDRRADLRRRSCRVFDGVAGLNDWQWLFLIEAIPAIIAGVFVLW